LISCGVLIVGLHSTYIALRKYELLIFCELYLWSVVAAFLIELPPKRQANDKVVKVKCTLVQALRLCTGHRPIEEVEV